MSARLLAGLRYADDQAERARRCDSKRRYRSWEPAELVARVHSQNARKLVMAYRCEVCSWWHNTTVQPRGLWVLWGRWEAA